MANIFELLAQEIKSILGNDYVVFTEMSLHAQENQDVWEQFDNIGVLYVGYGDLQLLTGNQGLKGQAELQVLCKVKDRYNNINPIRNALDNLTATANGTIYAPQGEYKYIMNCGVPVSDGEVNMGIESKFVSYTVPINVTVASGLMFGAEYEVEFQTGTQDIERAQTHRISVSWGQVMRDGIIEGTIDFLPEYPISEVTFSDVTELRFYYGITPVIVNPLSFTATYSDGVISYRAVVPTTALSQDPNAMEFDMFFVLTEPKYTKFANAVATTLAYNTQTDGRNYLTSNQVQTEIIASAWGMQIVATYKVGDELHDLILDNLESNPAKRYTIRYKRLNGEYKYKTVVMHDCVASNERAQFSVFTLNMAVAR